MNEVKMNELTTAEIKELTKLTALLNDLSKDIFGCEFYELDSEDQDAIYCYAEENEMI